MSQLLSFHPGRKIFEVQHQFSGFYPFLRLDFYKPAENSKQQAGAKALKATSLLRAAGLTLPGELQISEDMTVAQLEGQLLEKFGLHAQVIRQSGIVWLGTTMTDEWTLAHQNEHGREITKGVLIKGSGTEDFDLGRGNL